MSQYLLAIDQGTTSSRAIIYSKDGKKVGLAQQEYPQHFPHDGWVEHEPEDIWQTTLSSCRKALASAGLPATAIASIGITNQRETTVLWDRITGKTIYRAIVWQDRRTADYCQQLQQQLTDNGQPDFIRSRTGLLLDSYFSATKIRWVLDNVPGAREAANAGTLAFGTVDSFLLWKLTNGKQHCTDASNASRTLLFNIHTQQWDAELLQLFDIPRSMLPEVKDSAADFGETDSGLFGTAIPIGGIAGDQQAATFGQACFEPGMTKSTYGTGCFMLMNTGDNVIESTHNLLSTVAWRLQGKPVYALEGSIFMAGATMQWLRDKMQFFNDTAESEAMSERSSHGENVMFVPAFTGLGAPWWDADARGAIFGLTRDTGIEDIVTAALLSVCYQTRDLVDAMTSDGLGPTRIRVDGGMAANNFVMQRLADLLNCPVDRPQVTETTALGAACLAGLQCGMYSSTDEISKLWQLDRTFDPGQNGQWRQTQYERWHDAVSRTRSTRQ
ncbi:MAG: glycerol kinase GlpK [Gammaproteobacteria bacterium]|nr:glycerol kinase GlpK [Gammaproteobacteria bacterium]